MIWFNPDLPDYLDWRHGKHDPEERIGKSIQNGFLTILTCSLNAARISHGAISLWHFFICFKLFVLTFCAFFFETFHCEKNISRNTLLGFYGNLYSILH